MSKDPATPDNYDTNSAMLSPSIPQSIPMNGHQRDPMAHSSLPLREIPFQSLTNAKGASGTKPLPKSLNTCDCAVCASKPLEKTCSCMACVFPKLDHSYFSRTSCRFEGCDNKESHGYRFASGYHYERTHFGAPGNYHCQVKYCPLANKAFKRWPDLIRHSKVAHCKSAPVFTCHVLGCKYREKGFHREDKLTSHIKNVHAGKAMPGKGMRQLQPAVKKNEGSASQ